MTTVANPMITNCLETHVILFVPMTPTLKVQLALFPCSSSTKTRTVVFPAGKSLPDSGMTRTLSGFPELSLTIGSSHVTIARYLPGSVDCTMLSGQLMTGDSKSVDD